MYSFFVIVVLFVFKHTHISSDGFPELIRSSYLKSNKAIKGVNVYTAGNHRKWLVARENWSLSTFRKQTQELRKHNLKPFNEATNTFDY